MVTPVAPSRQSAGTSEAVALPLLPGTGVDPPAELDTGSRTGVSNGSSRRSGASRAGAAPSSADSSASGQGAASPSGTYDADSIETLEGLEAVRKRPAMYIGGNGSEGLMHLVWEIVDNSVDEAAAGFATKVEVTLRRDGSIEVADNGRGIPVDKHPDRDVSALEVVFTELHAGGKFGEGAYKASGGLHGVGASVVNALSTRLDAEVRRDGYVRELSFKNQKPGHFVGKKFKSSSDVRPGSRRTKATGTKVKFWPDMALFHPEARIDADEVRSRVRQMCYLVPGLRMRVVDNRAGEDGEPFDFVSRGGLADLVRQRSEQAAQNAVSGVITINGIERFTEKVPVDGKVTEVERECTVDIALRWVSGYDSNVESFVNHDPHQLRRYPSSRVRQGVDAGGQRRAAQGQSQACPAGPRHRRDRRQERQEQRGQDQRHQGRRARRPDCGGQGDVLGAAVPGSDQTGAGYSGGRGHRGPDHLRAAQGVVRARRRPPVAGEGHRRQARRRGSQPRRFQADARHQAQGGEPSAPPACPTSWPTAASTVPKPS